MNKVFHKKHVCAAALGFIAACTAVTTASAQIHLNLDYSASAGPVSQVTVANLKPNWVVTGVRDSSGVLEVISWENTGTSLERQGWAYGPVVGNGYLATVALSPNMVITSQGNTDGRMELTSWPVASDGNVTLGSTTQIDLVGQAVSLARLDSTHVVAAFNLEICLFSVNSNGSIVKEATAYYPNTNAVGIPGIVAMSGTQVVTAIENISQILQMDSWKVSGNTITHQMSPGDPPGYFNTVSLTQWGQQGHVATAFNITWVALEVIDWTVNPTTGAMVAEQVSLTPTNSISPFWTEGAAACPIGSDIFTAVMLPNYNIGGGVFGNSPTFGLSELATQTGEYLAVANENGISCASLSSGNFAVTAEITEEGNLQLDVWSYSGTPQ